jgi:hypothetical protein
MVLSQALEGKNSSLIYRRLPKKSAVALWSDSITVNHLTLPAESRVQFVWHANSLSQH